MIHEWSTRVNIIYVLEAICCTSRQTSCQFYIQESITEPAVALYERCGEARCRRIQDQIELCFCSRTRVSSPKGLHLQSCTVGIYNFQHKYTRVRQIICNLHNNIHIVSMGQCWPVTKYIIAVFYKDNIDLSSQYPKLFKFVYHFYFFCFSLFLL